MAEKAVATKEDTSIVTINDDLLLNGTGLEDTTPEDFAIPFIRIIQSGSPQTKKADGKYVKGAEEGDIINTVSNEITGGETGIYVVPVYYQKKYIEWKPRESGGGLVNADHERTILNQCTRNEKNKFVLENGNYIDETAQFYVMVVNEEETEWQQAVISMSSTQLGKARKWLSQMKQRRVKNSQGELVEAPMFMFRYLAKTMSESNDLGSWYGWSIGLDKPVKEQSFLIVASSFLKSVRAGEVKVKQEDSNEDSANSKDTDEVPF